MQLTFQEGLQHVRRLVESVPMPRHESDLVAAALEAVIVHIAGLTRDLDQMKSGQSRLEEAYERAQETMKDLTRNLDMQEDLLRQRAPATAPDPPITDEASS